MWQKTFCLCIRSPSQVFHSLCYFQRPGHQHLCIKSAHTNCPTASKSPQMEICYCVSFPFQTSISLIWWASGWGPQYTSEQSLFGKNTKCFSALFSISPWAGLIIRNNCDNILLSLNISNLMAFPILLNWKANKRWRQQLMYFFCFQVK